MTVTLNNGCYITTYLQGHPLFKVVFHPQFCLQLSFSSFNEKSHSLSIESSLPTVFPSFKSLLQEEEAQGLRFLGFFCKKKIVQERGFWVFGLLAVAAGRRGTGPCLCCCNKKIAQIGEEMRLVAGNHHH